MLLTEDGAFALFFRPHSGGFDRSRVPTPYGLCAAGIHLCTLKKPRAFSVLSHVAIHLLNRKQKMGKLTFGNICIVIAYHFYG